MFNLNRIYITDDVVYEKVYQKVIGEEPETWGYCDDKLKLIYIKLCLSEFDELDTTIHETLHAICLHYGIKIKHTELDKLGTALTKVGVLNDLIKLK